jgi:hypothetical protein
MPANIRLFFLYIFLVCFLALLFPYHILAVFVSGNGGISTVHQDNVPQIDHNGRVKYSYDETSFFPLALYWTDIGPVYGGSLPNLNTGSILNTTPVKLGTHNNIDYFKGTIDEVVVWNRALTANEIMSVKNGTPVVSGLVSGWDFENIAGGVVPDASGNGNTGQISGATVVGGKNGQGLSFNGTSDQVTISNQAPFNFEWNTPFSVSAWIKYPPGDQMGAFRHILAKIGPGPQYRGFLFRVDNTGTGLGRLGFGLVDDGSIQKYHWASGFKTALNDDQWHHVAATYNGNGLKSGITLYVDGVVEPYLADSTARGQAWKQFVAMYPTLDPNLYLRNSLPEVKAANFNTVFLQYGQPPNSYEMDFVNNYGLKIVPNLYHLPNAPTAVDGYVTQFKNHPALLMWHLFDEMAGVPKYGWDGWKSIYNTIKTIDPNRVVFANQDGLGCPFSDFSDILSTDFYPIGWNWNQSLMSVVDWMKDRVACRHPNSPIKKPVSQILQAFREGARWYYPTAAQLRNMAYGSIVGGVTSLWYFLQNSFYFAPDPVPYTQEGGSAGISPQVRPDLWNEATKINSEITMYKKVFLSKTSTENYNITFERTNCGSNDCQEVLNMWDLCTPISGSDSCTQQPMCHWANDKCLSNLDNLFSRYPLQTMLKETGEPGLRYLLAVNVDPHPLTGRFAFPWRNPTKVTSLFDNRNIPVENGGTFTDSFTPYGVALYKIEDPSYIPVSATPTPTPSPTPSCPLKSRGDLDCTNVINIFDYNILVYSFGTTGTPGWIVADINPDGKIDIFDYNILVYNFKATQ